MKRGWAGAAAAVGIVAVVSYAAFLAMRPPTLPSGLLYGSGQIEGAEIRVSAELPGRVVAAQIEEGQQVEAGDILVRLDDSEIRIRLAEARARAEALERSQARIASLATTAEHHARSANAELERYRALRNTGDISQQALEQARDLQVEARGQLQALQAQEAELAAQLAAAREQIRLLELQRDKTVVVSPIAGTVTAKAVEAGEFAVPGQPLAALVDLDRLKLKIYVTDDDLGKVKLGDPVRIRVNAFPERYFDAHVTAIDPQAQFTPRDIHLPDERARLVFGVTVTLEAPAPELKPGMPADAWIRWRQEQAWPVQLVVPR